MSVARVTVGASPRLGRSETIGAKVMHVMTSTDHKVIAKLYFVTTMIFFAFGGLLALAIRAEQQSPAATFEFLNQFFAAIVPAIHDAGGVVDKYLGDGLMALFPDAPAQAVRSALGVVQRTRELGASVGVGVHLGPVTLGLVGAAGRMESTVVSDAVNAAARIERLTRRFGADLLISAVVHEQLPPDMQADTRPLGDYMVPGKRHPVVVHEVFAGDPPESRAAKRASRAAVITEIVR